MKNLIASPCSFEAQCNFIELQSRFNSIKKQGWIKSKSRGKGAAGITFEILLGKERENFEIPDFEGIEIKTTTQNGYKIGLFNSTPDNELFEIKRIFNLYGYINAAGAKSFRFYASSKFYNKIPSGYLVTLNVNRDKKIVELIIYDLHKKAKIDSVSWSFELLKEKLYRKLKYLSIVSVLKKKTNQTEYYLYNNIKHYQLKGFDDFLKLLECGHIKIKFNVSETKNARGEMKLYDHGTTFDIKIENLTKLFSEISI